MRPNQGRLQTAEHILARLLGNRVSDAKIVIAKFEENLGRLEIMSKDDLRKLDKPGLQSDVNAIVAKKLAVKKYFKKRSEAEVEMDLGRIPPSVMEVRIVEITGFDKTPCKDPHVENTSEIGAFPLLNVDRVGKDRYRFTFKVD